MSSKENQTQHFPEIKLQQQVYWAVVSIFIWKPECKSIVTNVLNNVT